LAYTVILHIMSRKKALTNFEKSYTERLTSKFLASAILMSEKNNVKHDDITT